MSISVRDARQTDAPRLARLCTQLGYPANESDIPDRLSRLASGDNARVLVAVDAAEHIVGLETVHLRYTLNHAAPIGQITLLVVDEAVRGQGVGRVLVDAAERWVRERGCERIVEHRAQVREGLPTRWMMIC
jgi:GNAT superfamily N-acetyltransferase